MQRVFPATRTEFLKLDPVRVIPPILLGGVISLFAIRAGHRNDRPDIFALFSHFLNCLFFL
jgi:hypothetical protein